MSLETFFAYLSGSEAAIREIAVHPAAVWIGLILVASTAVSRNFARRDLRREPLFLLFPLLASLLSALLLFGLIHLLAWIEDGALRFDLGRFRSFLGLFWLMAPMAWLYALPLERLSNTAAEAVKARLMLLGVVATWRVLLTVRVLSVLLGDSFAHLLWPVLLFGDVVAIVALHVTAPRSPEAPRGAPEILELMGGILTPRGRERDETLRGVGGCLKALGLLALIPLLIATFNTDSAGRWTAFPNVEADRPSGPALWVLAGGGLLAWLLFLPAGQRKWRHAREIDDAFAAGNIPAAIAAIDARVPAELPIGWEPLLVKEVSRTGIGPLLDAVEATADQHGTSRARRAFFGQLRECLREPIYWYFDDGALIRLSSLLPRLPKGQELAAEAAGAIELFVEHRPGGESTEEERDGFEVPPARQWPEETPERLAAIEAIKVCAAKLGTVR